VTHLPERGVRVVLLDIEGTTTPIAFVYEVLFPYARRHLKQFLEQGPASTEIHEAVSALAAEHAHESTIIDPPPDWRAAGADDLRASAGRYALWLMDRDRKSPGLKLLQGYIWEGGYRSGELRGQVFDDVPAAIRKWHAEQLQVAIYSSGSALAQRRLFESLPGGDLTALISGFFDTAVGPKIAASSYVSICRALGRQPREVAFISDVTKELAAARSAGLQVLLSIRPGNPPQPDAGDYEQMIWT
jgi:2,3-diketo-5-methylthio-1-phosphopentane phosphatase